MTGLNEAVLRAAIAGGAAWRWLLVGYEWGVAHGHAVGRNEANQEWTDTTVAACRAGLESADLPAVRNARTTYSTPALTPEQIRRRAIDSWATYERDLTKERQSA